MKMEKKEKKKTEMKSTRKEKTDQFSTGNQQILLIIPEGIIWLCSIVPIKESLQIRCHHNHARKKFFLENSIE